MTGPTFSPDGKWMWDGNAWIPAPPQANVLPQASLNQTQISTVANNAGVPVNQLSNTAPYFDQNRDGILQNTELQQAAAAIAQQPTMPVPMQQPMVQQPMVQQPMVQQPMMQQNTMVMGQAPQQLAVISTKSKSNGKIITALLLVAIFMGGILYVWADNAGLGDDESPEPLYRWEVSSVTLDFEVTSMQLSEGDEDAWIVWEFFFDTNDTSIEQRDGYRCYQSLVFGNYMTGTWYPADFTGGDCFIQLNDPNILQNSNVNFCAYHNSTTMYPNPDGQMYDMSNWGGCGVENYPDFRGAIPELDIRTGLQNDICEPDSYPLYYEGEGDLPFEGGWDDSNNPSEQYFGKATVTFDIQVTFECLVDELWVEEDSFE